MRIRQCCTNQKVHLSNGHTNVFAILSLLDNKKRIIMFNLCILSGVLTRCVLQVAAAHEGVGASVHPDPLLPPLRPRPGLLPLHRHELRPRHRADSKLQGYRVYSVH